MKSIIKLFAIIIILNLVLWGCTRNGCTDKNAFNYDDRAKKDDCSCIYKGKVVVWFTEQTANLFNWRFGTNYCTFFIENELVAQMTSFDAIETAPGCDNYKFIYEVSLGNNTSKKVKLKFIGWDYYNSYEKVDSLIVKANECNVYELRFDN